MTGHDIGRIAFLCLLPAVYEKRKQELGADHPSTKLAWMLMCQEAKLPLDTPQHGGEPQHEGRK